MDEEERARIERECLRAGIAYARATDAGDGAAAARWFTDDGELEMPGGRHYAGREAIARRIDEQPRSQVSRHLLGQAWIEVHSADHASGALAVTLYRGERPADGGPVPLEAPFLVGDYQDDYHRTPQGWRIRRRRLTTVFRRT